MVSSTEALFASALGPEGGTRYRLSRAITDAFTGKAILEGLPGPFDLEEFISAGKCTAEARAIPHASIETSWRRAGGLSSALKTAMYDVTWEGHRVVVARAEWPEGYQTSTCHWVIADEHALAERFASAVYAYCNEPHQAILTFAGGCWSKSHALWKQVQAASFDELVLANDMGEKIRDDFASFLAAREEYARYGLPWKRGVLFLGPPGNGKTHCLRAVLKFLDVTCLYVTSLKARYETDDANIARVFERAREVTPCCIVFEDLDAMITDENRSVFLNELDGIADASGLLAIATTNHPEKLDPAILDRPSRFDRKYAFALPSPIERERYARSWNERLDPAMRIGADETRVIVESTDGFSFAYLKELFVASMIQWVKTREKGQMGHLLRAQLHELRLQMTSSVTTT